MDLDLVRDLEDCALSALPAGHTVYDDGWIVRTSGGQTGRNNAVVAARAGRDPLAAKIERVESFYRRLGRPALFYLSPLSEPPGLLAQLEERAYQPRGGAVDVHVASLAQVADAPPAVPVTVGLSTRVSAAWLTAYAVTHAGLTPADLSTKRAVMRAIALPAIFAQVCVAGRPVAVGSAVCHGQWVGLFDIAVASPERRRGLGSAVTQALLRWGAAQGAARAYLQVSAENGPGQRLYATFGFARVYHYQYRQKRWAGED